MVIADVGHKVVLTGFLLEEIILTYSAGGVVPVSDDYPRTPLSR